MVTNPSLTPRERLDALYTEASRILPWRNIYQAVALSLLEKCDALEAQITEAEKPCEWTRGEWDDFWSATCGKVAWEFNEGGPVENKVDFCPGCGHPVVVKGGE